MYANVWEPLICTFKADFHELLTVFPLSEMSYEFVKISFRRNMGIKHNYNSLFLFVIKKLFTTTQYNISFVLHAPDQDIKKDREQEKRTRVLNIVMFT